MEDMTRCKECNSVITKIDSHCYICEEPVPGAKKRFRRRARNPKARAPITPLSNLIFMASLVLTAVSFLSSRRMSVSLSITLSGILLLARIVADRCAAKQSPLPGSKRLV